MALKLPKTAIKKNKLNTVVWLLDHFSSKIGPNDLVSGLFLGLDINHMYLFWGAPIWPQNDQKLQKTVKKFLCCFGHLGTPKWTQKGTQRPTSGRDVWPNVQA
jgi:hypothetical protein